MSWRKRETIRPAAAALLLALALSACGGGAWVGWGWNDDPPHVSLVAPASASVGQTVRLAAAASDDEVAYVAFYRLDDNGNAIYLGRDDREPYDWDAVMPNTTAASVRFIARAVDSIGQWTDSREASVTVAR